MAKSKLPNNQTPSALATTATDEAEAIEILAEASLEAYRNKRTGGATPEPMASAQPAATAAARAARTFVI
ncbi:MAG TPA: hypothetical protein PLF40_31135, partial [Kofleriaceae bacterium]|nr:hypothetical protein [Kofleriaceae bacterium]